MNPYTYIIIGASVIAGVLYFLYKNRKNKLNLKIKPSNEGLFYLILFLYCWLAFFCRPNAKTSKTDNEN